MAYRAIRLAGPRQHARPSQRRRGKQPQKVDGPTRRKEKGGSVEERRGGGALEGRGDVRKWAGAVENHRWQRVQHSGGGRRSAEQGRGGGVRWWCARRAPVVCGSGRQRTEVGCSLVGGNAVSSSGRVTASPQ